MREHLVPGMPRRIFGVAVLFLLAGGLALVDRSGAIATTVALAAFLAGLRLARGRPLPAYVGLWGVFLPPLVYWLALSLNAAPKAAMAATVAAAFIVAVTAFVGIVNDYL
jgi:hypothetical protein